MRRYRPATKRDAVNFALRFLASEPFNTHTPGASCEVFEPAHRHTQKRPAPPKALGGSP